VEVDAGGSGGQPVTVESPTSEGSRFGLNLTLWIVVILTGALAITGAVWIWMNDDTASASSSSRAGEELGDARIEALPAADEAEQERTAAVIDSATKMSNAFLNLDYRDVDASTEAVLSLATGQFRVQYQQSSEGLAKVATRAKSVQTGEVVWSGVVASDEDSATVIVASSGTVSNKTTEFKAVPRNYRLQLDLAFEDDRWLTRDLQFVP
jgi:Mce-associated membrane protein